MDCHFILNSPFVFQVVMNLKELELAMFMSKTLISSIMSFTKREKSNKELNDRKSTSIYKERIGLPKDLYGERNEPSKYVSKSVESSIFTRPDLRDDYSASKFRSSDLDTRSKDIRESHYSRSRDPFAPLPPVIAPLPPVIRNSDYPLVSRPRQHEDRPRDFEMTSRHPRNERGLSPRLSTVRPDMAGFDPAKPCIRGNEEDYEFSKRIR